MRQELGDQLDRAGQVGIYLPLQLRQGHVRVVQVPLQPDPCVVDQDVEVRKGPDDLAMQLSNGVRVALIADIGVHASKALPRGRQPFFGPAGDQDSIAAFKKSRRQSVADAVRATRDEDSVVGSFTENSVA